MNQRDRKSSLKALFGEPMLPAPEVKTAGQAGEAVAETAEPGIPRTSSGAVKAMGLTLSSMTREVEEAKALRQALEEGERVVAMETDKIDVSFISDRLSDEERDDPDFSALVESMRENGQQVPILVRPHPQAHGRYQVAYGHRRLKAARRLGVAVKVIVRTLTDNELVLAQGKENAERRNLTFIERALFAKTLAERGFDRKLIGDALAVQKSELSRLIQVAEAVPQRFVQAIGPAPKAGRDRWMALGQLVGTEAGHAKAVDEIYSEPFKAAESDVRFQMLFDRLSRSSKPGKPAPQEIAGPDGRVFAHVSRQGKSVRIEFAKHAEPGFVEALTARLGADYAAYISGDSSRRTE